MRRLSPGLLLASSLLIFRSAAAASTERYTAALETNYHGSHSDLYAQQMDRVRSLVRQAQLEISSQLGLLQYQEGFRCPLFVRFDDTPAAGVEHAIAYVRIGSGPDGFAQQLVVNLDVWPKEAMDFDQVFYHEMTHAVLNDAVVSAYGKPLPSWVQEGLAVYIAGDGEKIVARTAGWVHASQVDRLIHEVDAPLRSPDYATDYLAFKFIRERYSINSLQAFVRDLIQGKEAVEAVEDSTGVSWQTFRRELKSYIRNTYLPLTQPG